MNFLLRQLSLIITQKKMRKTNLSVNLKKEQKKREEQEGFDKREFTYCRDILSQKKKENLAIEPYSAPMSCSSLNKNQVRSEAFDTIQLLNVMLKACLLYTSDAADEEDSVDFGGRRILNKKKNKKTA
eukprot:TRINITY_DN9567_c0_g1_i1.p1 TRINITY_DN9567_c0_g1~~TRINITY_DN9567_c0_g1_i1.p1  ORF type:complete len:128 (-),score=32.17 TRINITY_DN9567_c0_g1_i1:58-441(-)